MAAPTIFELARFAAEYQAGQQALLDHARRLGAAHGVDVVDVRGTGEVGVFEVRVRLREQGDVAAREGRNEAEPRAWITVPEPPFVSPVRTSAPFEGDGTADLPRFIREADPAVVVTPGKGAGAPVVLGVEERVRMLAGTIAGDVLLSLEHQGRHRDPDAVEAALRAGRDHYAAEAERAGVGTARQELLAHYDAAARAVRHQLGAA